MFKFFKNLSFNRECSLYTIYYKNTLNRDNFIYNNKTINYNLFMKKKEIYKYQNNYEILNIYGYRDKNNVWIPYNKNIYD